MHITRKHLFKFLRQALAMAATFIIVSLVLDWWRAPNVPPGAAALPLQTIQGRQTTLAEVGGKIVAAREGSQLVTAFHPELTTDVTVHSYFMQLVKRAL